MLIRRSGRRVAASRPQSPKQPSTRHHGLGNDVKGNEGGPQAQGHGELRGRLVRPNRNGWSYGRFSFTEYDPGRGPRPAWLCPGHLAATCLDRGRRMQALEAPTVTRPLCLDTSSSPMFV